MVVQDFPAAKLFVLILRQISKPISNYIKKQAKKYPIFRNYVCMPPANIYNLCEVKMKMWTMNLGKPINMPQLNEAMAIDLGSQILGEAVIFIIAAVLICAEYSRQANNEEKKEELVKAEISELHQKIQELNQQLSEQTSWIETLKFTVHELGHKTIVQPQPLQLKNDQESHNESVPTKSSEPVITKSPSEDVAQNNKIPVSSPLSVPSKQVENDSDNYEFVLTMP